MKGNRSAHTLAKLFFYLAIAFNLLWPLVGHARKRSETNSRPTPSKSIETGQRTPATMGDSQVLVNSDLVSFNVTVRDQQGRLVSGLPKSAFTVFDEKQPQEITFFGDDDAPVSVGIIFDISGSMRGKKMERAREALARFIQTSHPDDEYSLIGFSSRAEVLIERTRDADAVLNKVTQAEPQGNTALYDALYLGIEKLQRGTYPKQVLLLITDGGENDSRYTFKEVRNSLAESGVVLYSIFVLDRAGLPDKTGMRVLDELDELSKLTGGRSFYSQSSEKLDEFFERTALELRHQYSIGYRPRNFIADGRWHRLKVKVTPPVGFMRLIVSSPR
ncbi:MAG TPA: VWA domain-containing protein, partial [Pyrinomonadaceae bacterium]|nr:VWA domain-containing protein [Pyrinomonadaceae bacterium]